MKAAGTWEGGHALDIMKVFLAARTGNKPLMEKYVEQKKYDFNTMNAEGKTAREVAHALGFEDVAQLLPDAVDVAINRKAAVDQAEAAGGGTAATAVKFKFYLAPLMALSSIGLFYFDYYTDITLWVYFQNEEWLGLNTQCDGNTVTDCSRYKQPVFAFMSGFIIVFSPVALCFVDYFMMNGTMRVTQIAKYWFMNLTMTRMLYEGVVSLLHFCKGEMPQAGLSTVKASEGIFEAVPQMLLQSYIILRYILEPVHRKKEWVWHGNPTPPGEFPTQPECEMFTTMSQLKADFSALIDGGELLSGDDSSPVLPWDADPEFGPNCVACGFVFHPEDNQCAQNMTAFFAVVLSITIGLFSNATTIAMLPEVVRMQWRVAFFFLILMQVTLRLLCITMFSTVTSLIDITGFNFFFFVWVMVLYGTQVWISKSHRADLVIRKGVIHGRQAARKEAIVQRRMKHVMLVRSYDVLKNQKVQCGSSLDSEYRRQGKARVEVYVGDRIESKELVYLRGGITRVRIGAGWLSLQGAKGVQMLKPTNKGDEMLHKPERLEKFWIGLLTLILPVKFDTIKNLQKSNPSQEMTQAFVFRMAFNIVMLLPFIVAFVVGADPSLSTLSANGSMAGDEAVIGSDWSSLWNRHISRNRASTMLSLALVMFVMATVLYVAAGLIEMVPGVGIRREKQESVAEKNQKLQASIVEGKRGRNTEESALDNGDGVDSGVDVHDRRKKEAQRSNLANEAEEADSIIGELGDVAQLAFD